MRILGVLAAVALATGCGHNGSAPGATQEPAGVAVGARAPDAQLTAPSGDKVALAEALHRHAQTVVVFYRGFW